MGRAPAYRQPWNSNCNGSNCSRRFGNVERQARSPSRRSHCAGMLHIIWGKRNRKRIARCDIGRQLCTTTAQSPASACIPAGNGALASTQRLRPLCRRFCSVKLGLLLCGPLCLCAKPFILRRIRAGSQWRRGDGDKATQERNYEHKTVSFVTLSGRKLKPVRARNAGRNMRCWFASPHSNRRLAMLMQILTGEILDCKARC
jgi:hypothetical protein